jgi:hypothetical protein
MLITWALLASLPLWIEKVGLYQYLGVEILIWATYALAFNLVLGHAGLPSFGHGAFFGSAPMPSASPSSTSPPTSGCACWRRSWRQGSPARWLRCSSPTGAASISRS